MSSGRKSVASAAATASFGLPGVLTALNLVLCFLLSSSISLACRVIAAFRLLSGLPARFRLPAALLLSAAPPCLHFCAWLLNNRVASTPPELPAVHFKLFPSLRFNPGLSSAPLTRVAAALNPLPSPRELQLVQKSPFPTRNSSPGARNACLP